MDSPLAGTAAANLDLSKLTDRDKQELQQFVVNESQKARIQQCTSIHVIFLFASPSLTSCLPMCRLNTMCVPFRPELTDGFQRSTH